jgi:hypothetical protein
MKPIARSTLAKNERTVLDIAEDEHTDSTFAHELFLKHLKVKFQSCSGDLHKASGDARLWSEKVQTFGNALPPHQTHLYGTTISQFSNYRCDPGS